MSMTEGEVRAAPTIREQLNYERLSISHRAMQSLGDVVSHPAFLLSSGNTVLAWSTINPIGVAVQCSATIAIAFLVAKASWQNKPVHLPFYLLAALNIATAVIGVGTYATSHGLIPDQTMRPVLLGNAALAAWGYGHIRTAREIATGKKPERLLDTNMIWYGAADITAVAANPAAAFHPVPFGFAVAGTGLALAGKKQPKHGTFRWHITPARLLGAGYLANGVIALPINAVFAAASILWSFGAWNFDREQNQALRAVVIGNTRSTLNRLGLFRRKAAAPMPPSPSA